MNYYQMEHEEEYKATMCPICDERPKDTGHDECKFCARLGKTVGRFTNTTKPLHRHIDLMDQRGLQYE